MNTLAPEDIFLPVIALLLWTFIYTAVMGVYRVKSAKEGKVDPRIFKTYRDKDKMTDTMLKMSNHYDNLNTMPVLFYVICILIYVTQRVDSLFILLAWGYLITRVIHSFVHLGRNHPLHRFFAFGSGMVILLVMLLKWAVSIAT